MTDIELLPLPEGESSSFGNYEVHDNETMVDYARACVAHAVAPLQAEIERLRGEVISAKNTSAYQWQAAQEANKRAERLAEALRIAEAALSDIGDADREPGDDVAWCERRAALGLRVVRDTLRDPLLLPGVGTSES